ncbi:MAG: PE-PGRS family protein [Parcubacteria group bacterium Gr01-1014_8]|nr:MAG: PE-PGRS family protein [Parcubacteria group bacterium Gr01-1014_8]
MTLLRLARVGGVAAFAVLLFTLVSFVGNQRLAYADEVPVSGSDIVCDTYRQLQEQGLPIPPGLDVSGCEGGGGGGGGGEPPLPTVTECIDGIDNDGDGRTDFLPIYGDPDCDNFSDDSEAASGGGGGGGSTPACADGIDNDGDGLVDSVDPGCSDTSDTDEADPTGGGVGGGGGGGGGGPAAACEDSIDNDLDGLKDMQDPGCENASDNDETNGSGGGGGGGGGGEAATTTAPTPEILGASTPAQELSCDSYLTAFIRFGGKNDADQVMRLQKVLKDYEKADVNENGTYDAATLKAVHAFQTKYADEILTPWGIKSSTGYVYLTTRKKVNEIRCENKKTFPLSEEEQKKVEETRVSAAVRDIGTDASPAKPAEPAKPAVVKAKDVTDRTADSSSKDETVQVSGLKRVWDFLGRMFNRAR